MRALLFFVLSALTATLLNIAPASSQGVGPWHPLDALTPSEITTVVSHLRDAGIATAQTRFPMITLEEPPKKSVLDWREGLDIPRKAFVVLRKASKTYEARVDITAGAILSHAEVPGAQPSIMQEEWSLAAQLTMSDAGWRQAMQKRGITDFSQIACTPLPPGLRATDDQAAARLLKVPCYSVVDRLHPAHARPIEGVVAIVDVDQRKVVRLIDSGKIVPLEKPPAGYGANAWASRSPMKPVRNAIPAGSNISIRGNYLVNWQDWSFHLRADRRAGLIVSLVRFKDKEADRLIAYQMHVSEMFVPYQVPDATWNFRGFLDAGELGLGYLVSSLRPGADCPVQSYFVDLLIPSDKGGVFQAPKALCIFERATGNPAWRHYDGATQRIDSRPEIELVVRIIPTIGNYDYVLDYVFQPRGTIKLKVGATGLDAVRSTQFAAVDRQAALAQTPRDTLIAPYTTAPLHEHFVSYRLDLDIDGPDNVAISDNFSVVNKDGGNEVVRRIAAVRAEGPLPAAGHHDVVWRIANPQRRTSLGYAPSYQVVGGHSITSLAPENLLTRRAAFASHPLWLTAHNPLEKWAGGDYPLLASRSDGLAAYAGNADNVVNSDLVVWPTVSFRHITRPEDYPVLPTRWHEIILRPVHFFDRDPSSSLNPRFAVPNAN